MPSHVRIASVVSLFVALAARPALAQNLLTNGSFDGVLGFTHWTTDSPLITWSSSQCPGFHPLGSGSARFYLGMGTSSSTLSQCVVATPGSGYELSATVFLEESPSGSQGVLRLRFIAGTCESWTSLGASTSTESVQGECIDTSFFVRAPAETDAAIVELQLNRTTMNEGPIVALFDDVSLIEVPEPVAAGPAAALATLAALRRAGQLHVRVGRFGTNDLPDS